jgi:hypothetical protein
VYTPVMSDRPKRHVTVTMKMSRFELPPVESALVVGRKSPIGSNALEKALAEIMPGAFQRVEVQHPVIEAVIVRTADARLVNADKLVDMFVRNAEGVMQDTEALRVTCGVVISTTEELEV